MPNKKTYSEIDHIKEDINSLKTNVVELTKHLKKDAQYETANLKDKATDQIEHIKEIGQSKFTDLENQIKDKPSQSVALAFVSGLLLSMLMKKR